eukprot:XP_011670316.1 PREDICTED: histone-lysine N-methyltransferase SMYD3-like [Strongylocentrotus purpuratus]
MLNHSCDPNCAWVSDGRKLQIRTIKDVKEGEECTITYVDVMDPAKERQADLKEIYRFTCKCVKCIEEINALGPDDGLGEELQRLKKSLEQIKDAEKLCAPYLKPMDSSSNIPANHHLLYKVINAAFQACVDLQEWQRAFEIGQLTIEPIRPETREPTARASSPGLPHQGPFSVQQSSVARSSKLRVCPT